MSFGYISIFAQIIPLKDSLLHDFNNDGLIDSLLIESTGNVNYYAKYIDAGTKNEYEFCRDYFTKASFIDFMPFYEELEQLSATDSVRSHLLKGEHKAVPDPSLQWLLNAYKSKQKLNDNEYFDMLLKVKPQKLDSLPVFPFIYNIKIDQSLVKKVYCGSNCDEDVENYDSLITESKYAILQYYGHNHKYIIRPEKGSKRPQYSQVDSFVVADSNKDYTIYKTRHGLVAEKNNKYWWCFITDGCLTGGPEKLRWESIGKIYLYNDILVLKQAGGIITHSRFFLIDLKTGLVGRMTFEDYPCDIGESSKDCNIQQDSLIIKCYEYDEYNSLPAIQKKYNLKTLQQNLLNASKSNSR